MEDLLAYLQQDGTCKCGLECPFKPSEVFNFNPKVQSRFGILPNGVDLKREINCVVCKRFEEIFPQVKKPKPTRGRKPGGLCSFFLSCLFYLYKVVPLEEETCIHRHLLRLQPLSN